MKSGSIGIDDYGVLDLVSQQSVDSFTYFNTLVG